MMIVSLALFPAVTQSICASDEDVSGEVTGDAAAIPHKNYMKTKIVLGVQC